MADDIIALSRFRAALARARGTRRLDELLADPQAPALVPTLPALDVFYLIQEVGLEASSELVAMASPEQFQAFLDLDAWQGLAPAPERAWPWLAALSEAGFERLVFVLDHVDLELLTLLLSAEVRVYDMTQEEEPESLDNAAWQSPDRFFLVELLSPPDTDRQAQIIRLLEDLYRGDLAFARNLLMALRWELGAAIEEEALRFRVARLQDLGFPDPDEALRLYTPIDPASVKIGEGTQDPLDPQLDPGLAPPATLPAPYVDPLRRGGFLADVLATISDERELSRLFHAMTLLANHALGADRVAAGDLAAVEAGARRAAATLSLGLESVAGADIARGRQALATISLRRLFRVGASLAWQVATLARVLVKTGRVGRARGRHDLLDPPLDAVFDALLGPGHRPAYAVALDQPTTAPDPAKPQHRAFASVADVRRAAHALAEAQLHADLVHDGLRLDPAALPAAREDLRLGALLGTAAARIILGDTEVRKPLSPEEALRLRSLLCPTGDSPSPEAITQVERAFAAVLEHAKRPASPTGIAALVGDRLGAIARELGRLGPGTRPDPRFMASLWLDSPGLAG